MIGDALHNILDNEQAAGRHSPAHNALRWHADALQQDGPIGPAIEYVHRKRDSERDPKAREFWHRLLGSLRKAATM